MTPYVPDPLPLDCLDVGRLIKRVGTANAAIARYDGLLQSVVNPSATVIKKLKNAGILATIREPSGSRPAILAFAELVNQAEGRRVL